MKESDRIIGSVGTLFSALSHLIRGDLSVISNDLSFLSTLVPAGEVERAKNRCNAITTTLNSLQFIKNVQLNLGACPLPQLFKEAYPSLSFVGAHEYCCAVDPVLTHGVLKHLIGVFFKHTEEALKGCTQILLPLEDGGVEVFISACGDHAGDSSNRVGMLEAASTLLGESSVPQLALCDLVLAVQEISCTVITDSSTGSCSRLVFKFKLADGS